MCGGIETYEWVPIRTRYCENETLEMTEISIEDMVIMVRLQGLNPDFEYALFQYDDLNSKGFYHLITNCSEQILAIVPAPRSFALYRFFWKQTWTSIIEVHCN